MGLQYKMQISQEEDQKFLEEDINQSKPVQQPEHVSDKYLSSCDHFSQVVCRKISSLPATQVGAIALALLVTCCLLYSHVYSHPLPRMIWLYSQNQPESLPMLEQSMLNYYAHIAQKIHYEIRIITHKTAYQWISQPLIETISQARQRATVDVGVGDLLLMAVLIEHGGIALKNFDTIISGNLEWLEEGFQRGWGRKGVQSQWNCPTKISHIFLTRQQLQAASLDRFSDSFMAAVPQSVLLIKSMEQYIKMMTAQINIRYEYYRMFERNDETGVYSCSHLFEYSVSIVVQKQVQKMKSNYPELPEDDPSHVFGLQTFKRDNPIVDAVSIPTVGMRKYLSESGKNGCGKRVNVLIQVDKNILGGLLGNVLRNGNLEDAEVEEGSIFHEIITSEGNQHIFLGDLKERPVQLCIISLQEVNQDDIKTSIRQLRKQDFKNWLSVFIVGNASNFQDMLSNSRTRFVENRNNKGLNIEQAITINCPQKSFALLLNKGQTFNSTNALGLLAQSVKPRGVIGSFLPLVFEGKAMTPSSSMGRFYRKEDAILEPKYALLKNISNHLRLFSVECYKFLPQFDLRDSYGQYYEDRVIFLMSFLDMIREEMTKIQQIYIIKRYADQFDIPRRVVLTSGVGLVTDRIDQIDRDQMKKTFTRIETESMHIVLEGLINYRVPFDKMIVFNQGLPFQSLEKKEGESIIPAIIHQAWLGGKLPPVKQYFFEKTALMYPGYEMKLWTLQNITKDNFPLSYGHLKSLCSFNRYSPFNKFATMTDLLRHEALYTYGGFWKDASMNLLRPVFDKFRKYKLTIATDKTLRHRYLQGMCFFGNIKGYEPLKRIIGFENLNRMRIYNQDPMDIAGPVDFRQLITGYEEYDPDILVLSYQNFYPGQLGQHPAGDLCTEDLSLIPQQKQDEKKYEVVEKGWGVFKNCSEIYPHAFGIEHNRYGVSWLFKETLTKNRTCEVK